MGDAIYYATFMSFKDVEQWVKPTSEIHKNTELSRWIQRQLHKNHADRIADYLINDSSRFFNALVIGIYGGQPTWAPLDVSAPSGSTLADFDDDLRDSLQSSIGMLSLSGEEKLFAIDGQHRVAGIKEALSRDRAALENDEIIALFVGHQKTKAGELKTRRLFVTLNTTAKRVSDADRVALDEDDGFAVVTRRMIDDFDLLKRNKLIAFTATGALPSNNDSVISTIIAIYGQLKDLYTPKFFGNKIKKGEFGGSRPSDVAIDEYYKVACDYWKALRRCVPEVALVLDGKASAGSYREESANHLLMRPVGQRAFAGAIGVLVDRGSSLSDAVRRLSKVNLWLNTEDWSDILWDPIQDVMLKSPVLAESFLLKLVGEKARSTARGNKLAETLKKRG